MKKILLVLTILSSLHITSKTSAQCTNSDNPQWNPVPATNSNAGTFGYAMTAAMGSVVVSPSGTNAFSNNSSVAPSTAFFTKQGLQTMTVTFNIPIEKVATVHSFKISNVGSSEGQVITATDVMGNTLYPVLGDTANIILTGVNKNEIKGRIATDITPGTGTAEFSFSVPIKTMSLTTQTGFAATSGLNVIFRAVCAATTVPVELTFFKALERNNRARLTWQTASEKNNQGFEIQRSIDGAKFQNIGFVKGQGQSSVLQNYQFEDNDPLSILRINGQISSIPVAYYRLRQIDFDGTSSFSKVESIALKNKEKGFKIYPNPVHDKFATLEIEGEDEGGILQIINAVGSVIKTEIVNGRIKTLDMSLIPNGLYIVEFKNNTNHYTQKIFIAQ